jgi:hypothetical protein
MKALKQTNKLWSCGAVDRRLSLIIRDQLARMLGGCQLSERKHDVSVHHA